MSFESWAGNTGASPLSCTKPQGLAQCQGGSMSALQQAWRSIPLDGRKQGRVSGQIRGCGSQKGYCRASWRRDCASLGRTPGSQHCTQSRTGRSRIGWLDQDRMQEASQVPISVKVRASSEARFNGIGPGAHGDPNSEEPKSDTGRLSGSLGQACLSSKLQTAHSRHLGLIWISVCTQVHRRQVGRNKGAFTWVQRPKCLDHLVLHFLAHQPFLPTACVA